MVSMLMIMSFFVCWAGELSFNLTSSLISQSGGPECSSRALSGV